MTTTTRPATVAIVGAGLTGLLAAHGLLKAGFDVTLFEQEAGLEARRRDWPLLLHWALPTLRSLLSESAADKFEDAVCNRHIAYTPEVETMPLVNGVTGEVMMSSRMPGSRRVSRQRLRRVMAADLVDRMRWGKALTGVDAAASGDGPVRLTFADGTAAEADYVLGTDGATSKVRELLFGGAEAARVRPSGLMVATSITRPGDAATVRDMLRYHPLAAVSMGSTSNCGVATMYADDPDDMATWSLSWIKLWRRTRLPDPHAKRGAEALAYIRETSGDLIEPFRSCIMGTPDADGCWIDEMRTWVPVVWETHGGRVTLAGDAAHPMLVYRGQGYQHAVVDAERYVDALVSVRDGRAVRDEAVGVYTADVVERGAKAVTQSLREAEMAMDLESVKNMMMIKHGHNKAV